jgi:hypothetical protein
MFGNHIGVWIMQNKGSLLPSPLEDHYHSGIYNLCILGEPKDHYWSLMSDLEII